MSTWFTSAVLGPLVVAAILFAAKKLHKPPYWFQTHRDWLIAITGWRMKVTFDENGFASPQFARAMVWLLGTFLFRWP